MKSLGDWLVLILATHFDAWFIFQVPYWVLPFPFSSGLGLGLEFLRHLVKLGEFYFQPMLPLLSPHQALHVHCWSTLDYILFFYHRTSLELQIFKPSQYNDTEY